MMQSSPWKKSFACEALWAAWFNNSYIHWSLRIIELKKKKIKRRPAFCRCLGIQTILPLVVSYPFLSSERDMGIEIWTVPAYLPLYLWSILFVHMTKWAMWEWCDTIVLDISLAQFGTEKSPYVQLSPLRRLPKLNTLKNNLSPPTFPSWSAYHPLD